MHNLENLKAVAEFQMVNVSTFDKKLVISGLFLLLALTCFSSSPLPTPKRNQVICLDVGSGRRLWNANIPELGFAFFRVVQDGVLVSRNKGFSMGTNCFSIDLNTGEFVTSTNWHNPKVLSEYKSLWPTPALCFSNGWYLRSAGSTMPEFDGTYRFRDKSGQQVFGLKAEEYPSRANAVQNLFLYDSYTDKPPGILHAYAASDTGMTPAWKFDPLKTKVPPERDYRVLWFDVVDNQILVDVGGVLFVVDSNTGKPIEVYDYQKALKLKPKAANEACVFWKSGDMLIMAKTTCVLGIDFVSKRYRWQYDPSLEDIYTPVLTVYRNRLVTFGGPKNHFVRALNLTMKNTLEESAR